MSVWEKLGFDKKVEEKAEDIATQIEIIDEQIRELNRERITTLNARGQAIKDGDKQRAWVSEKSMGIIDKQLKDLNDKRNVLWEKQRREGEKVGELTR